MVLPKMSVLDKTQLEDRMRAELEGLFRLTERIHAEGPVELAEGRAAAGPLIEPLAIVGYFKIDGGRLASGSRMISADNARLLRLMMNHFLIMNPIWEAWDRERARSNAPPRRKKRTVNYYVDMGAFGAFPLPVDAERITTIASRLAERGLLIKSKDGNRNVYRFSDWFRACFPVLIRDGGDLRPESRSLFDFG
jgi:hypothetical protein